MAEQGGINQLLDQLCHSRQGQVVDGRLGDQAAYTLQYSKNDI